MSEFRIDFSLSHREREQLEAKERQAAYMAVAHRHEVERRRKRLSRLEETEEGVRAALAATNGHDDGTKREWWPVRRGFMCADPPRSFPTGDDSAEASSVENIDDRPPMTQLINRKARTLPFYLLACWEAQVTTPPGVTHRNERPRLLYSRGWDTLLGDRPLSKRNRNLRSQRVLEALRLRRLVELPPPRSPHRYDEFQLLREDQSGDPYSPPIPGDDVLQVPAAFITGGWHLVLEPPEIACYLMLLDLAWKHQVVHNNEGVGIIDRLRRSVYGITPEVYVTHNELAEFGLVKVTDSVAGRRRGRVSPDAIEADLVAFRFQIALEGLKGDAFDVVSSCLQNPGGGRVTP